MDRDVTSSFLGSRPALRVAVAFALVASVLVGASVLGSDAPAGAAGGTTTCSGAFAINETLPNGGQWTMCWEKRNNEGIVLSNIQYTAPGQAARLVMGRMYLGQIHVPYDDNGARYHDVSDYGLGAYMVTLGTADCPGGNLLSDGSSNVLCKQVTGSGTDYKNASAQRQGYQFSLFSSSQIGAYNYLVKWVFGDEGSITPTVGATGSLQRTSTTAAGSNYPLAANRFGINHLHNYYWHFDVDLGDAANDVVQQFDTNASADRLTASLSRTTYSTETAARVNPSTFRTWFIKDSAITNSDGHNIGYELIPSGDSFRGPTTEPWLQNDVYVVRQKDCEKYASHNPTTAGCAADVSTFVNGESLNGDLVIWYGTSFHHIPRDEDDPRMHTHWSSVSLVPRDLTATNLMQAGTVTTTSTSTTTTAAPTTTTTTTTTTTAPPTTTTTVAPTTTTTTTTAPPTTTTTVVPGTGNDNIANALVATALPYTSTVNTSAYTMEATDPGTGACSYNRSKSAWYRFTSPVTGNVTFSTAGSTFDSVLQVHTGTPPALTAIGCNDDAPGVLTSSLTLPVTAGTTYWVMSVSFANSAGGNLTMRIS